jgi:hypothetical protein
LNLSSEKRCFKPFAFQTHLCTAYFAEAQDEWEKFSDSANAGAPASLTGAQATSTNVFWLWWGWAVQVAFACAFEVADQSASCI